MSLTDSLRFAYVCPLAWDKLKAIAGADGAPQPARFCDACSKTVHDLSGLSRQDADAFLANAASARDSVCVRIERDAAGRARHAEAVGVRAGGLASRALTPAVLATAVALSGCMAQGQDTGDTGAAADTADTADTGLGAGPGSGAGGAHGRHRPKGTGLGTPSEGDADGTGGSGDASGSGSGDVAEPEADGVEALLAALAAKVMPKPEPVEEPVYITMGIIAMPHEPDPPPPGK